LFDWSPSRPSFLDAQYEIAAKVAATLGDPYDILFSNEAKRVKAASSAAFDPYACVLRFNAYWGSPRPAEHRVLRDCHEKSVSEVPAYADAWANLAWLYLDEARFGYDATDGTGPALDRAADAAFHAASLQPDSARAHLAMAVVQSFRQDPRGFEKHAELALSLNENDTAVVAEIGLRYVLRGDWDRGRPLLERAIARDPVRWQAYRVAYALHALETGDYTTALEEIGRSRMAEHPGMKALRAAIYGHLARLSDAREAWRAATQAVPMLAEAPRAWFMMRGVSDQLACSFVHGLDRAGLLDDD
jgi:tetratricopeptide (TPR) repeat protein